MRTLIIILLLGLTVTKFAFGCQCKPIPFDEEVKLSKYIFHGRVVKVDGYTFTFEVIKSWKGNFEERGFKITQENSSCDKIRFGLGKEYIVYLIYYTVYNCSRTHESRYSTDSETLDLLFLNKGDKEQIQGEKLTDHELNILTQILKGNNSNIEKSYLRNSYFAIEDRLVTKKDFLYSITWMAPTLTLVTADNGKQILWTGFDNRKLKKLKRRDLKLRTNK